MSSLFLHVISRVAAESANLKWYYTGDPCKHGHLCERQTVNGRCRFCGNMTSSKYASRNKQKINKRVRDRYWALATTPEGREKITEKRRASYQKHYDRSNKVAKEYANKNKEEIAAYKLAYYKKRYAEDLEFKGMAVMRDFVKRVLRSSKSAKKNSTNKYLGYSPNDLINHLESQFTEGMSWSNHGEWHIDHIKPVSVFIREGETDPGVINALSNLQPLWAADNMSKRAKWEAEND